jgi:hypothetical protein
MSIFKHCTALIAFGILAGCTPPPLVKLDAPIAEVDKADHVVIFLAQSEVAVDDADVANAGGGLLGVLIEAAIESTKTGNRQKAITPLRDALIDYRFEAQLTDAIRAQLPTRMVKADAAVTVVRNDAEWRAHLAKVIPAHVFFVHAAYAFEQDFEIAYVNANVALRKFDTMPPDDKQWKKMSHKQRKAAEVKPLHQGAYSSQHVTRSPLQRRRKTDGRWGYEQNAADWNANGAEPVRSAFARGAAEVAALIRRDGEQPVRPAVPAQKTRALLAYAWMQPMLVKADFVEASAGRSLVQIGQNTVWVDDRQIKR